MTNRLLAVEFVRLWRHRAKPASEGIRRISERHRVEEEPASEGIRRISERHRGAVSKIME